MFTLMLRATRRPSLFALVWFNIILLARAQVGLTSLRVDNLGPFGPSIEPFFSWDIESSEHSVSQTSYQILVSRSPPGREETWNSGFIISNRTQLIKYTGPQLLSNTHYTWTVEISTSAGLGIGSSTFSTNLLNTSGSKYRSWARKRDEFDLTELKNHFESSSSWIWTTDGNLLEAPPGNCTFRYRFVAPSGETVLSTSIRLCVDDHFLLYVNGVQIAANTAQGWGQGHLYSIIFAPKTTQVVFVIVAINGAGPAGVLAAMRITLTNGISQLLQSDDSWRSNSVFSNEIQSPNFNDTYWPRAKVLGRYGDMPWGKLIIFPLSPRLIPLGISSTPTSTPTSSLPTILPSISSNPIRNEMHPNTTAIVGGVLGGTILILVVVVGYICCYLKTRNHTRAGQQRLSDSEYTRRDSILSVAKRSSSPVSHLQHLPPPSSISPPMSVPAIVEQNHKHEESVQRANGNLDFEAKTRLKIIEE